MLYFNELFFFIILFEDYYTASREIQKVFNIYDHMKNENIAATYKSLNNYLEIAMRTETIPRIVEALKEFKKRSNKFFLYFIILIFI